MTSGWNGRFYNAIRRRRANPSRSFGTARPSTSTTGSCRSAFASRPDRQGDQTNYIAYGPMVKGADKFVNPDILPHLPTAPQNTQSYFLMDQAFWADHRESTSARMVTWMAK